MAYTKFLHFILIFCWVLDVAGQNVGVGTTAPQYKLDVAGRIRLKSTAELFYGLRFDTPSFQNRAFVGQLDNNKVGMFGYGGAGWGFVMDVLTGNVAMGHTNPMHKLDLKGRMRIQNDTSSAGIWLDGTSSPTRSLIGAYTDNYFGIYGNGGAGWGFLMNVNNGNIGIGTTNPTAKLDINGDVRIRNNASTKGSVLTSFDSEGNAHWQGPEAFKAGGTANNVPLTVDNLTWTKVLFNQTPVYNVGIGYLASVSEYEALVKGVFSFNAAIAYTEAADKQSIRIRLNRAGVITTIGEIYHQGFVVDETGESATFEDASKITLQADLIAGDRVWVESYIDIYANGGSSTTIDNNSAKTWFSGKLLFKN